MAKHVQVYYAWVVYAARYLHQMVSQYLLLTVSRIFKMRNLGNINGAFMRNTAIAAIVILVGFASCDKIAVPLKSAGNKVVQATLPTTPPDRITRTTDTNLHKGLLEDYMGHFCTNCPAAVSAADAILQSSQGNQVVAMEVNVGYDADTAHEPGGPPVPGGLPDTAYFVDYRTQAGTDWDNQLTQTATFGVPQGMICRIYDDANFDQDIQYSNWATIIDSIVATPQNASITMVDSCWIPQQVFGTAVTVTLKNPVTTGAKYFLEMVLVEDSILDWQTNGTSAIQYFPHRFVLRSSLNGSWGDSVSLSPNVPVTKYYAYTSNKFRYNSAAITTPPAVPARLMNMAKCYVVAFIYQRTYGGPRDYYVLQAQIVHL
jgi:hypothetical protein